MAKQGKATYSDAQAAIELCKVWRGGSAVKWLAHGGKGMPDHFKCRAPLQVNGVIQEGLFVDLYFKKSVTPGVPDKINFSLMFNHARVMGMDDNGPTRHMNTAGRGLPYHMQIVDHPHWHLPAPDTTPGYAEPFDRQPIATLWRMFCERANISDAPDWIPPMQGPQLDLL